MLYCFDKNENLLREINSDSLVLPIQTESLNSLMILEFGVFVKDIDLMEDVDFVAHKDMENPNRIQMYRVLSSTSEDSYVSYQAIHILFDELKAYGYIRDRRLKQVKASTALEAVLQGSRWKVGACDGSDLMTTNFYDVSRLEALSKVINTWGLDLDYYLTFDGSKISGRYIRLVANRGEDTGERFVYGSNALEVVAEIDKSEIYTRIIPRGRGEEKFDENGISKDTFGRRIRIDEVVWSKSKGDLIDKPLGQEYLELEEATKKFGFSDGTPRTKVQVFDDIEKPEDLIKAGYDFLVNISRPLTQFKSKVFKKSRTSVGDIVRIIRKDLDIYYMTRIFKVRRNLITKNVEVEFGDNLIQSQLDREKALKIDIESLKDKQKNMTLSFNDRVTKAMTDAMFNQDGYNYELKQGNEYGLPAGYYSFDREIDDNPTRVIYVGAGTMAIANSKKSNGDWNFRTFGTGDGFVADLLVAGMIRGGNVRWNLEDGTFIIGESVDSYSMYWDGSTLHLRNVDIDLSNNNQIADIENNISNQAKSIGDINTSLSTQNQEIISMKSDFKLDLEGIKTSFEKRVKGVEDDVSSRDSGLRSYIQTNYSTKTQTANMIESKVSSINSRLGSAESRITQTSNKIDSEISSVKSTASSNYNSLSSRISQTDSKVESRVTSSEARSIFRQEASSFTFDADQVNFNSNVNIRGMFETEGSTYDGGASSRIKLKDGAIQFWDQTEGEYSGQIFAYRKGIHFQAGRYFGLWAGQVVLNSSGEMYINSTEKMNLNPYGGLYVNGEVTFSKRIYVDDWYIVSAGDSSDYQLQFIAPSGKKFIFSTQYGYFDK